MITESRHEAVVDAVHAVAGTDIRVVGVVSEDGEGLHRDLFHMRGDVAAEYTDDAIEAVGTELLFQLWNRDWQGELFNAGTVQYSFQRYEEGLILMCYHGELAIVVSVDPGTDAHVRDLAGAVRAGLNGEPVP